MSIVGNNIRALRTLYGEGRDITQAELAEIAGVTRETVNKWESGSISNVRTSNINRLRDHFGLSVDDLRSESAGLAARLKRTRGELEKGRPHNSAREFARVPLLPLNELACEVNPHIIEQKIEIPAFIANRHPNALAFVVEDSAMSKVLPVGCHAIVDAHIEPGPGAIVVAQLGEGESVERVVRRLHKGASKIMLSDECDSNSGDYVYDANEVEIVGTVVWYQAPDEMN